jgi:hypothetical protein
MNYEELEAALDFLGERIELLGIEFGVIKEELNSISDKLTIFQMELHLEDD